MGSGLITSEEHHYTAGKKEQDLMPDITGGQTPASFNAHVLEVGPQQPPVATCTDVAASVCVLAR